MKTLITTTLLFLSIIAKSGTIDDGWYKSSVNYSNYSTGTYAKYTLNVKVEYDRVVAIDFGNDGSVHSGCNDEDYTYSGGYLTLYDYYGTNYAEASVTVYTSDGSTLIFKITIE